MIELSVWFLHLSRKFRQYDELKTCFGLETNLLAHNKPTTSTQKHSKYYYSKNCRTSFIPRRDGVMLNPHISPVTTRGRVILTDSTSIESHGPRDLINKQVLHDFQCRHLLSNAHFSIIHTASPPPEAASTFSGTALLSGGCGGGAEFWHDPVAGPGSAQHRVAHPSAEVGLEWALVVVA
jgi:hypothetical protein